MKILIAAILLLGICIFGMCFNIIFRKEGKFPETEVGHNKDMKRLGIKCAKVDELALRKKMKQAAMANKKANDEDCESCGLC